MDLAMKQPRANSVNPPIAAPMPIPAFAPVERLLLSTLGLADTVGVVDTEATVIVEARVVVAVTNPVEDVRELVDTLNVAARILTLGLLSGSVQQSFESPQHHLVDELVPSQEVIIVFPYVSTAACTVLT
jgi:hypothetical protein